jgi:hypothetical protein
LREVMLRRMEEEEMRGEVDMGREKGKLAEKRRRKHNICKTRRLPWEMRRVRKEEVIKKRRDRRGVGGRLLGTPCERRTLNR